MDKKKVIFSVAYDEWGLWELCAAGNGISVKDFIIRCCNEYCRELGLLDIHDEIALKEYTKKVRELDSKKTRRFFKLL